MCYTQLVIYLPFTFTLSIKNHLIALESPFFFFLTLSDFDEENGIKQTISQKIWSWKKKKIYQVSAFKQLPLRLPIPVPSRRPLRDWFHHTITFCFLATVIIHILSDLCENRGGEADLGVLVFCFRDGRSARGFTRPPLCTARQRRASPTAPGVSQRTVSVPRLKEDYMMTQGARLRLIFCTGFPSRASCTAFKIWSRNKKKNKKQKQTRIRVTTSTVVTATGIMWVLPYFGFQKLYIYSHQIFIHLHFEEQKSVSVQINGDFEKDRMQTRHQFSY